MESKGEDDVQTQTDRVLYNEESEKPPMKCSDYFMEWKKCICENQSVLHVEPYKVLWALPHFPLYSV